MPKTIQILNVPDDLYAKLRAHAAEAHMSLSDYLLEQLERSMSEQPTTITEILDRLTDLEPVDPPQSSAEMVRELRGC